MDKPQYADGYHSEQLELVKNALFFLASKIGNLIDETVVIGGLVPPLLIDQEVEDRGFTSHVGTRDLDMGLKVGLLKTGRYKDLSAILRSSGFKSTVKENGNKTLWQWEHSAFGGIVVEFLMPEKNDSVIHMEPDFAAIPSPELEIAFRDRVKVEISGRTPQGASGSREVWICGPASFVVLKACAFADRTENKDAYDLFYVLTHYHQGPEDVARILASMKDDPIVEQAIGFLKRDFREQEGLGPVAVSQFLKKKNDDETQADVAGTVNLFLKALEAGS